MVTVDDTSFVSAFASFSVSSSASAPAPAPVAAPAAAAAPRAAPVPSPTSVVSAPIAQSGGRVFASPLARKLARDAGLDITLFQGSGPNGRIVAADVTSGAVAVKAKSVQQPAGPTSAAPSVIFSGTSQPSALPGGVYQDFQGTC